MAADDLRRIRITGVPFARLEWAVGREVSLPASVVAEVAGSPDVDRLDVRHLPAPHMNGLAADLRLRAALERRGFRTVASEPAPHTSLGQPKHRLAIMQAPR